MWKATITSAYDSPGNASALVVNVTYENTDDGRTIGRSYELDARNTTSKADFMARIDAELAALDEFEAIKADIKSDVNVELLGPELKAL